MKTAYLTEMDRGMVIDPEINSVDLLRGISRYNIRSIYKFNEPMHVIYGCGDKTEEVDVKKGDILIQFYQHNDFDKTLAVIKSKDWCNRIDKQAELDQKEKEEWAAKCEACDCCNKPC